MFSGAGVGIWLERVRRWPPCPAGIKPDCNKGIVDDRIMTNKYIMSRPIGDDRLAGVDLEERQGRGSKE
jgi:hypothetical protein